MATKLKTVEDAVNDRLGEEDKLRIWNRVCKTDPKHTKKVNQRGGFTAISAHYQVLSATAEFGPVGIGWGYTNGEPVFHETLVIVPVTIWHGDRGNTFGPLYGAAEWKDNKGRIDSDAAKKASTDGLTKGLSQLGFNADVFLGKFDDNKYVAEVTAEFHPKPDNPTDGEHKPGRQERIAEHKDDPFPQGPAKNKTHLKDMGRAFWRDVEACGDPDELDILLAEKTNVQLVNQIMKALPNWWDGGTDPKGEAFEGLDAVIARKRRDFEQLETANGR